MNWRLGQRIAWKVRDLIPDGFEFKIRFYCSTCQEEVDGDLYSDFKTHECEESKWLTDTVKNADTITRCHSPQQNANVIAMMRTRTLQNNRGYWYLGTIFTLANLWFIVSLICWWVFLLSLVVRIMSSLCNSSLRPPKWIGIGPMKLGYSKWSPGQVSCRRSYPQ